MEKRQPKTYIRQWLSVFSYFALHIWKETKRIKPASLAAPKGSNFTLRLRNEIKLYLKKKIAALTSWNKTPLLFPVHTLAGRARPPAAAWAVIVQKKDGDINHQRLMIRMWTEGLVYRNSMQFKIYKRFNATAWQSLKSTAQKTVTLRKILQL